MPNYGDLPAAVGATTAGPTAVSPGDSLTLFSAADVLMAPQASIVLAPAIGPAATDGATTFFVEFAAAPTDSLQILGSNKAPATVFNLADWYALWTSTNKQQDYYTDAGQFAYYCAYLATQTAGGKVSVIAQR